jgi:hypothetical protein
MESGHQPWDGILKKFNREEPNMFKWKHHQYGDYGSKLVDAINKGAESSLVLGQEKDVGKALENTQQQVTNANQ